MLGIRQWDRLRLVQESAFSLIKAENPTERSRVVEEGRCSDELISSRSISPRRHPVSGWGCGSGTGEPELV